MCQHTPGTPATEVKTGRLGVERQSGMQETLFLKKKKKKSYKKCFLCKSKICKKKTLNNLTNVDESQNCYLRKGKEMSLTGFFISSKNKPCLQCFHLQSPCKKGTSQITF